MIRKFLYALFAVCLATGLVSCREDEIPLHLPATGKTKTVFLYIAFDNSNDLSTYGYQNINQLLAGSDFDLLYGNNLIVYFDPRKAHTTDNPTGTPQLIKIECDMYGNKYKTIVRQYEELNSGTGENLTARIEEVMRLYPADEYGLILSSHGSGWLPSDLHDRYLTSKAILQDGEDWVDIDKLSEAIPSNAFDYIILDACFMGAVEVVYELKDKTPYLLVSPAEILGNGFPYTQIPSYLFKENTDLVGLSDAFYEYYKSSTATITMVRTDRLEQLARRVSDLVRGREQEIAGMDISGLQTFDRYSKHTMFDLGDFLLQLNGADEGYEAYESAMDAAIVYKNNTPSILNTITVRTYSGLSTYVPITAYEDLNEYYKTTSWYRAVYAD